MATVAPPRPPSDELEDLIPEARERQRRRRLIGATVIVTAAALGLGLYAVVGGFSEQVNTGSSPSGAVPLCRSSQISVGPPDQAMSGLLSRGVNGLEVLTNTSDTSCALPLQPPAARITWHHELLRTHQERGRGVIFGSWLPLRFVHLLKPGGRAAISLYWENWCGRPHSYRPMTTVHLRFDQLLAVSFVLGPHAACITPGSPSTLRVSRPILVR